MNRIQKVSSYLLWVFNFLLASIPLWVVAQWTLIEWRPFRSLMEWGVFKDLTAQGFFLENVQTPEGVVNLTNLIFTPLSWSIGFLGGLLGILPLVLGIFILKHLFQNYRKGEIFSFENVQKFKYLGWLLFLNALFVKPLSDMMMVLTATLSNPPGHRYISLYFGTPNVEDLFWGILLIVVSWIMAEAYKLQEEQCLTV